MVVHSEDKCWVACPEFKPEGVPQTTKADKKSDMKTSEGTRKTANVVAAEAKPQSEFTKP